MSSISWEGKGIYYGSEIWGDNQSENPHSSYYSVIRAVTSLKCFPAGKNLLCLFSSKKTAENETFYQAVLYIKQFFIYTSPFLDCFILNKVKLSG